MKDRSLIVPMKFPHCSKIVRLAQLILFLFALATISFSKEKYEIKLEKRYEVVDCFVVYHNGKEIFTGCTDYGGYSHVAWSKGQKYFAIVDYAIKRGFVLYVYQVKGDEVTEVKLPDYRINILGRYGLVKGGQYYGYDKVKWTERAGETLLEFDAYGSFEDEIGGNWVTNSSAFYNFNVTLLLENGRDARLKKVKNLNKEKPELPKEGIFETAIYVKADIKKVWSMLVNADERKKASMLSLSKMELKKGGAIVFCNGEVDGKIIDFEKEKMLKHTYRVNVYDVEGEDLSVVCYSLQDQKDGTTLLHVTHDEFKVGSMIHGETEIMWPVTLSKIKTYLETGKPLRKE